MRNTTTTERRPQLSNLAGPDGTVHDAARTNEHSDTLGRVYSRRDMLGWILGGAGSLTLAAAVPAVLRRGASGGPFGLVSSAEAADLPTCVVRPSMTEGPFFVDELLNRSDIRSDTGTGAVSAGKLLALSFNVMRIDGASCTPLAGAVVDLWHADAYGHYSDVNNNGYNAVGLDFLRGYQVSDSAGAASFTTIYPGWYNGRTVHMHFKIRVPIVGGTTLEFTSQLFFDDTLTDAVYTTAPYSTTGTRSTRNSTDSIYSSGGSQMLLTLTSDGSGGYVASFDIGLAVSGAVTTTTTTSTTLDTTTTTLVPGTCATIADCLAALGAELPDPADAVDNPSRRIAERLQIRIGRIGLTLDAAAVAVGAAQVLRYTRARTRIERLLILARRADAAGNLDADLAAIESAAVDLLAMIPA